MRQFIIPGVTATNRTAMHFLVTTKEDEEEDALLGLLGLSKESARKGNSQIMQLIIIIIDLTVAATAPQH